MVISELSIFTARMDSRPLGRSGDVGFSFRSCYYYYEYQIYDIEVIYHL